MELFQFQLLVILLDQITVDYLVVAGGAGGGGGTGMQEVVEEQVVLEKVIIRFLYSFSFSNNCFTSYCNNLSNYNRCRWSRISCTFSRIFW
jgi:hypothetical protein